jgi:hypothetical protein
MPRSSDWRLRVACLVIAAAVGALEVWAVLVDRDGTFAIEGEMPQVIRQFGEGQAVRQAFLMQGDGLHQVRVMVSCPRPQDFPVQWSLWRGTPDEPATFTTAFAASETWSLHGGRQWLALRFPRDGLSGDRWYTIEVKAARPDAPIDAVDRVGILASQDNPERGGVLWLNDVRQPGSLTIRADRQGRTLFRRFEAEALPHLPSLFGSAWLQWLIVIALHWAFWIVAYAVLRDGWLDARGQRGA